ncbi:hypothetical protein [Sedimentitalea nanhaiensis]|uniref:hypothetical protein n=1 Tax=Sedimentitalea nanhaiensis TaxID=999627 RepID=UPI0013790C7E|nr:hypothetical protein [Sedimentitalea nanhaiensis]
MFSQLVLAKFRRREAGKIDTLERRGRIFAFDLLESSGNLPKIYAKSSKNAPQWAKQCNFIALSARIRNTPR